MRKTLADEFSTIYIYNLRGNGRVAGDAGQREGRPVFEFGGWKSDGTEIKDAKGGSRTTIAITVLVKNPARTGTPVEIKYAQVADYLSAGQKIKAVSDAASFNGLPLTAMTPNDAGDWLNQRNAAFDAFPAISGEPVSYFTSNSRGLETTRDAWVYNASRNAVESNMRRMIDTYNEQAAAGHTSADQLDLDPTRISWSSSHVPRVASPDARLRRCARAKRAVSALHQAGRLLRPHLQPPHR